MSQGPKVPGLMVPGSQSPASQRPGVPGPRSKDPKTRVSGPDFRLCLLKAIHYIHLNNYFWMINVAWLMNRPLLISSEPSHLNYKNS